MKGNLNKGLVRKNKLTNLHHFNMTARRTAWQRSVLEQCGTLKLKRNYTTLQEYKLMNTKNTLNHFPQYIKVTTWHGKAWSISTIQAVNKWQDDLGWWLEIIRLPELLLPRRPQIIFTTNQRRIKQHINQ